MLLLLVVFFKEIISECCIMLGNIAKVLIHICYLFSPLRPECYVSVIRIQKKNKTNGSGILYRLAYTIFAFIHFILQVCGGGGNAVLGRRLK